MNARDPKVRLPSKWTACSTLCKARSKCMRAFLPPDRRLNVREFKPKREWYAYCHYLWPLDALPSDLDAHDLLEEPWSPE